MRDVGSTRDTGFMTASQAPAARGTGGRSLGLLDLEDQQILFKSPSFLSKRPILCVLQEPEKAAAFRFRKLQFRKAAHAPP